MDAWVCFCCLWFSCAYEARSKGETPQMKCLRRIMAPRADGKLLVPQAILDAFRDIDNGGRESVLKMWESSEHNKDSDQFVNQYVWDVRGHNVLQSFSTTFH